VFTREPYPVSGPLARHPKVIATAHNAALTTRYFRRAAQALGDALAAVLDGRPLPTRSTLRPSPGGPSQSTAPTPPPARRRRLRSDGAAPRGIPTARWRLGRARCEGSPSRPTLSSQTCRRGCVHTTSVAAVT
jgi:hypothetical protein